MREGFMQISGFDGVAIPTHIGAESKPASAHYINIRVTLQQYR